MYRYFFHDNTFDYRGIFSALVSIPATKLCMALYNQKTLKSLLQYNKQHVSMYSMSAYFGYLNGNTSPNQGTYTLGGTSAVARGYV